MDVDASTAPSQSYTILRIKRKRNEEPLDALVVERRIRRRKTRGGPSVFQYAQTVEDDVWKDEKTQKDIQDRISRLAKENATKSPAAMPLAQAESTSDVPLSPTRSRKEQARRYTVVSPEEKETLANRSANSPKVLASKDLTKHRPVPDFKMYDAILSEKESISASQPDPEMDKFLPLLNDYLRIHDIPTHTEPNTLATASHTKPGKGVTAADESDDYVWDVFYHRPASLSEWNAVAARTGTITGLPGSAFDSDDSDTDSEAEDEADEDSNAEEYYKNDYPDEESDSEPENSDEFHEDSDYDDMMHYHDDEQEL
ncbi:hypothetical protein NP233_g546 [Leucocoprinus birnbaumii]|uniref:Probable RNA polymerase II nuclear localization protein SLC7A6OS n=1 Tax=Leucocoprinus birnbaumii TaxID=56174 RepID=A0AAD5YWM7_9AGAR|nr:hypothetical protein NP233_g546 [Leucocoprinus birnbaumii]